MTIIKKKIYIFANKQNRAYTMKCKTEINKLKIL